MPQLFNRYKKIIDQHLIKFLHLKQKELAQVNTWSDDVFDRLCTFVSQGKSIRGSFILFTAEAYGKKISSDTINLAAAVELIHSGFLIHDDIIDQDRMRRGHASMYAQYEELGKKLHITKPFLYGQDLAVCAGDLTFFLAMNCVSSCSDDNILPIAMKKMSKEYQSVCLAQMQDTAFGFVNRIPTTDEVLSLYKYKTARYTFSLPFTLGGITANIPNTEILNLEKLGEQLGIIFQLRDDVLNLFGNPKFTGKPVGSDIREGKKTLAIVRLFTHASNIDRQKLQSIMKLNSRTSSDIAMVYKLMEKYQIQSYLESETHRLAIQAQNQIEKLSISTSYKKYMSDILKYVYERSK
jgi:geranylgeranyl diphosphate synthase, type I